MNQPKIGYLPLYIKLYDDNHQDRTPLVRYMETMICMLQSQGLEIVRTEEICRTKEEFARAAETFNRAGVDAVVTQHLAYSPSLESIDALLSLDAPIFVLDSTPDYQLVKTANYQNCIDNDHGIHGVQDMCCMLKKKHRDYTIFAGHALHSNVIAKVADACRAAAMAKAFRTARIGAVGGAFEGMGDFAVTPERLKKDFGIEVLEMTPEVTAASLAAVAPEQIAAAKDAALEALEAAGRSRPRRIIRNRFCPALPSAAGCSAKRSRPVRSTSCRLTAAACRRCHLPNAAR